MNTSFFSRHLLALFLISALFSGQAFAAPAAQQPEKTQTAADGPKAEESQAAAEAELKAIQDLLDHEKYSEAVSKLKPLAGQGNAEAMYVLGYLTQQGKGVKTSPRNACELFRKAALKGDVRAMTAYGKALANGHGVKRNSFAETRQLF